jgi:hypothetical protein
MIKFAVRLLPLVVLSFGMNAWAQKSKAKTASQAPAKQVVSTPVQQSFYADFEYELQTTLTGGGLESLKKGGETTTVINFQASVTKVIRSNLQAGVEAQFFNESGGGGSSYFEVLGVGLYNFDNNLKESLYAKAGLGMLNVINDKFKNEAKFAFLVGGGKRIPILDRVTYTPEARIIVVDGGTRFQVMALNFSILY